MNLERAIQFSANGEVLAEGVEIRVSFAKGAPGANMSIRVRHADKGGVWRGGDEGTTHLITTAMPSEALEMLKKMDCWVPKK